ncbi:MAG: hypothetical protein QW116_01830 [Zestosphaera sp.]
MTREFKEVSGKWITLVTLIYYLEGGIYELVEDYGCVRPRVEVRQGFGSYVIEYCCEELKEVPKELLILDEAREKNLVSSYNANVCRNGVDVTSILNNVINSAVKESVNLLLPYSTLTRQSGIEHLFVILNDGKGYLIEGERNRAYVPLTNMIISMHTHPDNCIPSPHDVRALSHILMGRGFGGGIVASDCHFAIMRVGPFLEEDMMELIKFRNALREMRLDRLNYYLGRGGIGTNLRIYTNYVGISQTRL